MTVHPKDRASSNPRIQCSVCGKWKRLHTKDKRPPYDLRQTFFGGCSYANGDHLAGDRIDVCADCCEIECKTLAAEKAAA
jgi:hypothetical protein